MMREDDGFTLIELMVVVVIVAVLLALSLSSFMGFESTARSSAAADELRSGALSARSLRVDTGSYATLTTEIANLDPGLSLDPNGERGVAILIGASGDACLIRITQNGEIMVIWLGQDETPAQLFATLPAMPATCPDHAGAVSQGFSDTQF